MKELRKRILDGMLDFIEGEDDAEYTPKDVDTCEKLLLTFSSNIEDGISCSNAMEQVKILVLSLNELNEKCDYSIIETDQREDICEFIFQTLISAGIALDVDVTEEWRDW
ncbi:hypothetical protein MHO82_11570 [Vibrio sp. Of7-15]|uniref:hypothetical protein n=1 Tax=Vibrio sp. Of7-15 TaxID=2724879 RepID=UPI001EF3A170|nr:hypothetical protein [Vibrio sp. Of7-15]MCG7497504.1 hypothetical protein [Vibrio sp. Of7-15]